MQEGLHRKGKSIIQEELIISSMYINKVILGGSLGRDPEIKGNPDNPFATFSIATTKEYKTKSGEKKEQTTWHNIVVGGNSVNFVKNYIHKGDTVLVEGEYVTREYTNNDGYKTTVYEVRATNVQILKSKEQRRPADDDMPEDVANGRSNSSDWD